MNRKWTFEPIFQGFSVKRGKGSLPVDVRRSKTSLRKRITQLISLSPGRLLNFWTLKEGAYSRWGLFRAWPLINFSSLKGGRLFEVGRLIE